MTSTASMTSTTSVTSIISTASCHQKTYWAWCFDPPWHQNDLFWFVNVGLITDFLIKKSVDWSTISLILGTLLQAVEDRNFTCHQIQGSIVHCQWPYRYLSFCVFWVQRPCKCNLHYCVLRPMTQYKRWHRHKIGFNMKTVSLCKKT